MQLMKILCAMYGVVAKVLSEHAGDYDRRPYGKKMCVEFGYQLLGYPSLVYDALSLSLHCHISSVDGKRFMKAMFQTTLKGQCHNYSRIVRSRQNTSKCKPSTGFEVQPMGSTDRIIAARIIAAPSCESKDPHFYQLSISDLTVSQYDYLNMSGISAIGFLSKSKKFIICLCQQQKILLVPLDKNEPSTVSSKGNITVHAIAIDQLNETIFLSMPPPFGGLFVLNTDLQSVRLVRYCNPSKCLAVDPKLGRLYTCLERKIVALNYDGCIVKAFPVVVKHEVNSLAISYKSDKVYYNDGKHLKEIDIRTKVATKRAKARFKKAPLNLIIVEKYMYVSYPNRNIDVYEIPNFKREKRFQIPGMSLNGFVICYVK